MSKLQNAEKRIESGLTSVREGLTEIHDLALWKSEYPSFEKYLADRWNISKSYGYRLIAHGRRQDALPESVAHGRQIPPILPERAARELGTDNPDADEIVADATEEANKRGVATPTAKDVRKAKAAKKIDDTLPPGVVAALASVPEFAELQREVKALERKIIALAETPPGRRIGIQTVKAQLRSLWQELKFATPHGPCPMCRARGCKLCAKSKWVSVFEYRNCVPKEMK